MASIDFAPPGARVGKQNLPIGEEGPWEADESAPLRYAARYKFVQGDSRTYDANVACRMLRIDLQRWFQTGI